MAGKLDMDKAKQATAHVGEMYTWSEGMDWNAVEKVIMERRSVRKYKDKQVPEKLVRRILEAGRFAPSAGNSQPWTFVVIRDKKIIDDMEKAVQRRCKLFKFLLDWQDGPLGRLAWFNSRLFIRLLPNMLHPIPFGALRLVADGKLKVWHGAPTVIIILQDKRGVGHPSNDIHICGQNMILAAHSLGLGTCWVGFVEVLKLSRKWKKLLGLEWPFDLGVGISLGYPVGEPDGMVARELLEIDWWEDGHKRTLY